MIIHLIKTCQLILCITLSLSIIACGSRSNSRSNSGGDAVPDKTKSWHHPSNSSDNISIDGQDAQDVQVAMNENGNAIITWQQYDANYDYQIFMSQYRDGIWSHPLSLDDNISQDIFEATNPRVAMDNNGNAIIVWQQSDGGSSCFGNPCIKIFMSEYRNGIWTHPSSLTET